MPEPWEAFCTCCSVTRRRSPTQVLCWSMELLQFSSTFSHPVSEAFYKLNHLLSWIGETDYVPFTWFRLHIPGIPWTCSSYLKTSKWLHNLCLEDKRELQLKKKYCKRELQFKKIYFFFHIMQIYPCALITNLLQTNSCNKSVWADNEFCWRAVFGQT